MSTFEWLQLVVNISVLGALVTLFLGQRLSWIAIRDLLNKSLEERKHQRAIELAWNSVYGKMAHTYQREYKSAYPSTTSEDCDVLTVEAANKWGRVDAWFAKLDDIRANPNGYTRQEIDAFWDFIVKLREED